MPEPDISSLPTDIDGNNAAYAGQHDNHHDDLHAWAKYIQALDVETALTTETANRTAADAATLASANAYADTLASGLIPPASATATGDGTTDLFTVGHSFDTEQVLAAVRYSNGDPWSLAECDPIDNASVRVRIDNPVLASAVTAQIVVYPMGGLRGADGPPTRPALYAVTGYTATIPTGSSIAATYSDEADFTTSVVPDRSGLCAELLIGAQVKFLESRWNGSAYYWREL